MAGRHFVTAFRLFQAGHVAAEKFLSSWDFAEYKARFRAKAPPTRHELLDLSEDPSNGGPH